MGEYYYDYLIKSKTAISQQRYWIRINICELFFGTGVIAKNISSQKLPLSETFPEVLGQPEPHPPPKSETQPPTL